MPQRRCTMRWQKLCGADPSTNEPTPVAPADNIQELPTTSDDEGLKFAGIVTVNTSSKSSGVAKSFKKYDSLEGSTLSISKNKIA